MNSLELDSAKVLSSVNDGITVYEVDCMQPRLEALQGGLKNVFAHWREIQGEKFAPSWREFNWDYIPTELIPWFAVVDVKYEPLDFIYRFWGSARTRVQDKDYTGKSVRDFQPLSISKKAFNEYQHVVDNKSAIHLRTKGLTNFKNEPFTYDFLRLPFSYDGERVDNIIGVGLYDAEAAARATDFYCEKKIQVAWPS